MTNLAGLHDIEAVAIAPPDTWILDTVALSENPQPKSYPASLNIIARMNWGYGSTGTLPAPDRYGEFAARASVYVRDSQNCHRWIIANEPNLPREWPAFGYRIFPWSYATCYGMARKAIHMMHGHEHDEVLIAASGPWNDELKYPGNPTGDWIQYFTDVIKACGEQDVDGFALHAYTHGYDPALVKSTAKMGAPFQNRYYEFRTYQDYIRAIPESLYHLPVYITEANGNGPWRAVGLMPAMLDEINGWNDLVMDGRLPAIRSVIFYRYPHYDDFYIAGKDNVIAEYQAAVGKGYTSPTMGATTMPETTFIPAVSTGTQVPALPPRQIDPRATARGVKVKAPTLDAGTKYWFAKNIRWVPESESGGRHHIYGNCYIDGQKMADINLRVGWGGDHADIRTEDKSKDTPPWDYWYNYPMSPSLNDYWIQVLDAASETVYGIGMGADGNSHVHTSTIVEWELVTMPGAQQPAPTNTTPLFVNMPKGANLRQSASTDAPILQGIPYGEKVDSFGTEITAGAVWNHVVANNGVTGWILGALLSPTAPSNPGPTPVTPPAPTGDKWQRSREFVRRWEGDYQNNPADIGNWTGCEVGKGENRGTKYGISACSYPQLDIPNLSMEEANAIYERDYWRASGADKLPWPYCLYVFDTAVLHGVGTARKWQEEVGDNAYAFAAKRLHTYTKLGNWKEFGAGWVNRVGDLLEEASK